MTTTGFRDMHAVESQKQRYSRELAAYTLRQWDVARQAMENGERGENMDAPMHSSSKDSNRPSKPAQGQNIRLQDLLWC